MAPRPTSITHRFDQASWGCLDNIINHTVGTMSETDPQYHLATVHAKITPDPHFGTVDLTFVRKDTTDA